jgi:CelD/BcsL family acetyltransferase involved in cellulose biosynthesis
MSARHADTARSVDELATLRSSWEAFPKREVMADPEHFLTVLEHREGAVRPHVVRLSSGDEPVALVAGRIEDIELPARIGYRKILSPRLRALTVVQGGYLGDPSQATAAAALSELVAVLDAKEADVLRLRLLEVGSPLHTLARTTPSTFRRERMSTPSVRWQLTVPDSYDDFLRGRSKSTRSNLRYYANRLRNEFGDRLRLDTFHDGSDLERLYRDTATVAAKTYQHALGAAFRDDALTRALTDLSVRRGWFRAHLLYIDETPVAFWQGMALDGVIHTGYTGYDPAYGDFRVGTYVLMRLIEDACLAPGISLIDFGYGDADYKRRLADRSWLEEDVLVFGKTRKALTASVGRSAVLGTAKIGRGALRRSNAVSRLKRWWRKRLRAGES